MTAPYHLPLSQTACAAFLESQTAFEQPIEAAGMFAALTYLAKPRPRGELDHFLRHAFPLFEADPAAGHAQLLGLLAQSGIPRLQNLIDGLLALEVCLVTPSMLAQGQWRGIDGGYSTKFQEACSPINEGFEVTFHAPDEERETDDENDTVVRASQRLIMSSATRDQTVAARLIASSPEERIAIDAYAGTGKTFLTHALQAHLTSGFTYVARSDAQIYGYQRAGLGATSTQAFTLNGLAYRLLREHVKQIGMKFIPMTGAADITRAEQAQLIGVGPIGQAPADEVIRRAYLAIGTWCNSDDSHIEARHFLRSGVRDYGEMSLYIQAARQLWSAMFSAPLRSGRSFDVWDREVAKWLVLQNAQPPARFGVLLVDEAHDLPPVWLQLLWAYAGGCILMGDPHQKLHGKSTRADGFQSARMSTSYRVGLGAAAMIESTLSFAPARDMTEFTSTRDHVTRVRYYDQDNAMPEEGLRLYGNEWAMLAAALRLKAANAPFKLLPSSERMLKRSVRDALTLFEGRATWLGFKVNGCTTLDALVATFNGQGLGSIVRMFERGFDGTNLLQLTKHVEQSAADSMTLGLIDHAKNLEFPTVTLAPCCFEDSWQHRGFQPVHASYLGMSRSRHALWLPGDTLDRMKDQKKRFDQSSTRP